MRYRDFEYQFLDYVCRDCLNNATGLKLRSKDCHHDAYPRKCTVCGDMRHLIRGLYRSGRWKVLFFRPKKQQQETNP